MTSYLLVALLLLQVGDCATSVRGISSGRGREANPVVRRLIDRTGIRLGLIIAKLPVVAAAMAMWWQGYDVALLLTVAAYAAVFINNIRILVEGSKNK